MIIVMLLVGLGLFVAFRWLAATKSPAQRHQAGQEIGRPAEGSDGPALDERPIPAVWR